MENSTELDTKIEPVAVKKVYSTPRVTDLGAVHGIVMSAGCCGNDGTPGCTLS